MSSFKPPKYIFTLMIRQFRKDDQSRCADLFSQGIRDVWIEFFVPDPSTDLVENYISGGLHDDMADIQKYYLKPGSNFWVFEDSNGVVQGMVGLVKISNTEAELRRMSIAKNYRRTGLGKSLVDNLEKFARENGYKKITLSVASHMPSEILTYWKKLGFSETFWKKRHKRPSSLF